MRKHVWILAFIDDPLDPPGEGRFGGGQSFMFDLGRGLVRAGFDVTFVTELNDEAKPTFERFGPRSRLHRIQVGEVRYKQGEELGLEIEKLAEQSVCLARAAVQPDFIHAQYWVSAAVALEIKSKIGGVVFYYPLSFGRQKRRTIDPADQLAMRREEVEPTVLRDCDYIVVGTPEERNVLKRHYPGVRNEQILLAPLWSDAAVFHPRPERPDHFVRRAARRYTEGF